MPSHTFDGGQAGAVDVRVIAARSPRRYLSRRHVAELFGVSVSTVTRWAQRGLLATIRTPGGHYRFPAEETHRAAGANLERAAEG